jgi:sigma-B regulation protein RsbU (phosphoserine phosphatase)
MIMAQAQSLFRVASTKESNAAHIMQTLNEILCLRNKSNMFITFFIGVLDLPTGRLSYCNAGHDKPVIVGKGQLDANPHLPLGVFDDVSFSQQEMMLEPGTMLFLYTDGLTEAMNVRREQFGLKRVQETVVENDSCEALVTHVTKAVHDFAEGAEQSDDLTLLAIRYQNKGA